MCKTAFSLFKHWFSINPKCFSHHNINSEFSFVFLSEPVHRIHDHRAPPTNDDHQLHTTPSHTHWPPQTDHHRGSHTPPPRPTCTTHYQPTRTFHQVQTLPSTFSSFLNSMHLEHRPSLTLLPLFIIPFIHINHHFYDSQRVRKSLILILVNDMVYLKKQIIR